MKIHNSMRSNRASMYACKADSIHSRIELVDLSPDQAAKAAALRIIAKVKKARKEAIQVDQ